MDREVSNNSSGVEMLLVIPVAAVTPAFPFVNVRFAHAKTFRMAGLSEMLGSIYQTALPYNPFSKFSRRYAK